MTRAHLNNSLGRSIDLAELKGRIEELNFVHAMRVVTDLGCIYPWLPDTVEMRGIINSTNLSLLAKGLTLWSNPGGRPLNLTDNLETDEKVWLLRAVNSLRWYSEEDMQTAPDDTMVAYLVRQAYLTHTLADPLDGMIGRNFLMFHDLIREVNVPVKNLSSELRRVIGVGYEDMWAVLYCVYAFYFMQHRIDPNKWSFTTTSFFSDTGRDTHWNGVLATLFTRISGDQQKLQDLYDTDAKYKDTSGRTGAWLTEFNILRDYPVVEFVPGSYCSPFPPMVFQRAAVGFYYDLLEDYATQKRQKGSDQPYRNAMSETFQLLYQRYVGLQLEQLTNATAYLSPEFKYGPKNARADSPDWILTRPGKVTVFFECKARRPSLVWQSQALPEQLDKDIFQTIAYALNQISKFLKKADEGVVGLDTYKDVPKVVFALVMHDPFPFHAIPDLARRIEQVAVTKAPDWAAIASRVDFVPMSVRELETAVGLEIDRGIPIEDQLQAYAEYRRGARRVEFIDDAIHFPRHLEEYLQERWNNSRRITNPLIEKTWDRFSELVSGHIYGTALADYEAELRHEWITKNAYFRWIDENRPDGRHLEHWHAAENRFAELEQELGMAPYAAEQLSLYDEHEESE